MTFRNRCSSWLTVAFAVGGMGQAFAQSPPLTGSAAFGDWRADKPGTTQADQAGGSAKAGRNTFGRQRTACGRASRLRGSASARRIQDRTVRGRFERTARNARRAQWRHLRRRNRTGTDPRAARRRWRRKTDRQRGLRQRAQRPIRHRVLPCQQRSQMGLCRQQRQRRPLSLSRPATSRRPARARNRRRRNCRAAAAIPRAASPSASTASGC